MDQTKAIAQLVEYGNKIKEITAEEKTWQEQLKKGEITQEEYDKKMAASNEVKKEYRRIVQETSKEIQNSLKQDKNKADSLKSLRAELSNATKRYDEMSKAERDSAEGQDLLLHIKQVTKEIKNVEEATERYYRNVGNYKNALIETGAAFKQAGVSTKGFDQSLKLLNANPWVALLMAAVTIVKKVIEAFKGNEEAVMALKQAFSAFNPIMDNAKRGLEAFANIVVNVVTKAVSGLTTAIGWLLDKVQQVGNFFGADWHMGDNFREGVAAAQELQDAENEYIKHKRAWEVESAKIDRDVADLREKAADKEKYTAQERIAFLDQAIAKETEKAAKEKALAEENLRLLQQEAARSANSASMNDKLAEAERAVIEADKQLSDTKRRLSKERQSAINETNAHTAATKANTQAVKDDTAELERQAKAYHDLTIAEMQKAEDALNNIIEDAFEKRRAIEETNYKRQHDRLLEAMVSEEEAHGTQTELYQAYMTQWEALETQHQQNIAAIKADEAAKEAQINAAKEADAKKTADNIKKIEKARLDYTTQIVGSLSQLMETVAGDNEEMVKASKVIALAEVAIKQGQAIAEAVASAAAGDPYTYALRVAAAIASTVAAMASAISSINSAKFARGTAYVKGPGTSTSDSIPAMLSVGEGVVNARGNAMFPGVVEAMNAAGNGIYSPVLSMLHKSGGAPVQVTHQQEAVSRMQMASAMKEALQELNLSVSVEEIKNTESRVRAIENLATV